MGYGDFVARSNLGHTLSVSEAMIGQIYLVTVVSLIVSNLRRPEHRAQAPWSARNALSSAPWPWVHQSTREPRAQWA